MAYKYVLMCLFGQRSQLYGRYIAFSIQDTEKGAESYIMKGSMFMDAMDGATYNYINMHIRQMHVRKPRTPHPEKRTYKYDVEIE